MLRADRDARPFVDIDAHDAAIIQNHNAVVGPKDDVWNLGDVAFSKDRVLRYVGSAKGRVHLVRGNHDDKTAWALRDKFASFQEARYLRLGEHRFFLMHYAMRVWRNSHHGSHHLHGHSHGRLAQRGRSMDVGVMCHQFRPVHVDEVLTALRDATYMNHHVDYSSPETLAGIDAAIKNMRAGVRSEPEDLEALGRLDIGNDVQRRMLANDLPGSY